MKQVTLTILIALLLLSCSKKSGVEIKEINGLKTYLNRAGKQEADLPLELVKLFTIKAQTAGGDSLLFTTISALTADEDGNLYLLDNRRQQVVIFDKNGKHLKSFGRNGQGPGEFVYPMDLVFSNGRLIVFDSAQRKFLRFDREGNYLDYLPSPHRAMLTSKLQRFGNNYLLYTLELFRLNGEPRMSKTITALDSSFKKIMAIDSVGDSWPPRDSEIELKFSVFNNNDSLLVIGRRDKQRYYLKVYDQNLKPLYAITKKQGGVPVSQAERDSLRASFHGEDVEYLEKTLSFADYKFALSKIWLDRSGYLWVERAFPGNVYTSDHKRFDLFKDGCLQGSVNLPFFSRSNRSIYEMDISGAIDLWNFNNRFIYYDQQQQTITVYSYRVGEKE